MNVSYYILFLIKRLYLIVFGTLVLLFIFVLWRDLGFIIFQLLKNNKYYKTEFDRWHEGELEFPGALVRSHLKVSCSDALFCSTLD